MTYIPNASPYKAGTENSVSSSRNAILSSRLTLGRHATSCAHPAAINRALSVSTYCSSPEVIDPAHAPRLIKVLDDAKAVTERTALEALYGKDLSNAKVIVTEFKIPLDKTTYQEVEGDVPQLGSGKTLRIGFFVDDNDTPYTDVQRLINWPATFSMFGSLEDAARAVLE